MTDAIRTAFTGTLATLLLVACAPPRHSFSDKVRCADLGFLVTAINANNVSSGNTALTILASDATRARDATLRNDAETLTRTPNATIAATQVKALVDRCQALRLPVPVQPGAS